MLALLAVSVDRRPPDFSSLSNLPSSSAALTGKLTNLTWFIILGGSQPRRWLLRAPSLLRSKGVTSRLPVDGAAYPQRNGVAEASLQHLPPTPSLKQR
jgi:hypothetical protein